MTSPFHATNEHTIHTPLDPVGHTRGEVVLVMHAPADPATQIIGIRYDLPDNCLNGFLKPMEHD